MPNIVYIATSLDGFIARKDGNLDWLMDIPNPENSDYGFSLFMESIDGIIMGRKTFEAVVSFNEWPYTRPVFVLSNKLKSAPGGYEDKIKIVSGKLEDIVGSLSKEGVRSLYIDGGKTIQSFLREDLIDELIITRIPILLGSGISLFDDLDFDIKFKHIKTEVLGEQLVKTRYLKIESKT